MPRVYVLGAGFSAAAADLPLMADMSEHLRNLGEIPERALGMGARSGLGFEGILAYLANDQPFLSTADNLRNRAAFEDVTQRLARLLFDIQEDRQSADWLGDLVRSWNAERADVITLNYDVLVEKSASACFAKEWKQSSRGASTSLWPISIPLIGSRYHGILTGPKPETFSLAKLHGSIGWVYAGIEAGVGAPLYDLGVPDSENWGDYTRTARDLVPVIVPPALAKTPWLTNLTLRAVWREAGLALQKATEVVVFGYSMPEADVQVRALLATGKPHVVVCIDPRADAFEKCKEVWPDCPDVRHFASVDSALADGVLGRADM